MAGVVGAHHTSFTVADLDRSVAFLRDLLGLELLFVREIRDDYFGRIVGLPGCAVRAALLRIPGSGHHVEVLEYLLPRGAEHRPRPCDPGSSHLALLVDDVPALYQHLRPKGIAFVGEPVRIEAGPNRGGYGVYLRDPNGILIELFQPPGRAPA
jgi:catechol 2,3-dioxygenase-like lactoylglutathione lyase family enzyme